MRQHRLSLALLVCALIAPSAAHAQEAPDAPAAGASTKSNPWLERRVLNIAHQGGEHEAPSNTMFTYKSALAKGADVLEMDVQLTADGHIVVFHDRGVAGRTDGTGDVNMLTLEQIKALDPADNWDQYRGIAKGAKAPPDGFTADDFKIPTLREVLEQFPDQLLNIEIKGLAPDSTDLGWHEGQLAEENQALETAVALAALLREYKRDDDVIVVSFSELALQRFKAEAPEIQTAAGLESAAAFYGSSVELAPGLTNAEHVALQVPEYFEAGDGAPPLHVVTKDFVDDAHANGLAVHVWLNGHPTENDETYDRLTALGVDGIMTDQPTRLESNYRRQGIAEEGPRPFHNFGCTAEAASGVRFCEGTMNSRVRTFDGVPVDANVALPPAPAEGEDGNYPLIIQLHGWGGRKSGLNAMRSWAEDGYAVLNYSARGFGESCGSPQSRVADPAACSQGWVRLADSRFEVRDSQYLAGLLADQGIVDPQRIGAMGGSYGGGQSLQLAVLRDRVRTPGGAYEPWVSEKRGLPMRIAAAAPTVPWSDLVYSLTPNGRTRDYLIDGQTTTRTPPGVMKASFVSGLFAAGAASGFYAPPGADTQADLITWYARIVAGEPYEESVAQNIADQIAYNHSAYHLNMDVEPAPTLISNGWPDDLFPVDEAVRFANKVEARHPGAEIAQLHLDYGHQRGTSPKPADGGELDRRTREWMDRYVKGDQSVEALEGVTALTQTCPKTDPSTSHHAANWHDLHPGEVRHAEPEQRTVLAGSGDPQVGKDVDPIAGLPLCADHGAVDDTDAAAYTLPAATGAGYTLLGSATVVADIATEGSDAAIAARLWDVAPEGTMKLVARAIYRPDAVGRQVFQLHPNAWHFKAGHSPRLELIGADAPYARPSNDAWMATISDLELRLPVAEEPDCRQVLAPAAPVVPEGAELAPGVDATPRDVCAAPPDGGGPDPGPDPEPDPEPDGHTDTGTSGGPTGDTPLTTAPAQEGSRPADPAPSQAPPAADPPTVELTAPRLASEVSRGPRVALRLTPAGPADHYELEYRTAGSSRFRRLTSDLDGSVRRYRFDGEFGTTYEFRARAVSGDGRAGAWDRARSVVPFDDFRRLPDYARDSWDLVRTRGAFGGRVTRSSDRDAELRLRFRGTRLYLIGRRSPRGGPAIAILDGERRRIGFRARRIRERAVIAGWRLAPGGHRLRVVNLGRGRVEIDGFGVDPG